MIKFDRPVAFFDIEATGTDRENDRIVELCIIKVNPDRSRESITQRFNPGFPIPAQATEVHGISDQDVADCPTFEQAAEHLITFIEGCDFAGFGSNNYDIPMLYNEFIRAGFEMPYRDRRFIDVGNIFKIQEPRTLGAAVKFYLGRELEGAHGAKADTEATIEVFRAMLQRYPDLPQTMDEMHTFCNHGNQVMDLAGKFVKGPDGIVRYNFGKTQRGKPVTDDLGFLQWMLGKGDFAPDTMRIANELYDLHILP